MRYLSEIINFFLILVIGYLILNPVPPLEKIEYVKVVDAECGKESLKGSIFIIHLKNGELLKGKMRYLKNDLVEVQNNQESRIISLDDIWKFTKK
jgi:hypothetical protein